MASADRARILTINAGSSSLKAALYDMDRVERLLLAVQVERIGQSGSQMRIVDGDAVTLLDRTADLDTHATAARAFLEWLHHRSEVAPGVSGVLWLPMPQYASMSRSSSSDSARVVLGLLTAN